MATVPAHRNFLHSNGSTVTFGNVCHTTGEALPLAAGPSAGRAEPVDGACSATLCCSSRSRAAR
jgi:hypothetical protein